MKKKIDLVSWTKRYKRVLEAFSHSPDEAEELLQCRGHRDREAGKTPEAAASEVLIENGRIKI